jgi:hypothetical protein
MDRHVGGLDGELVELRRRIQVVLDYLATRTPGDPPDGEYIRQILTRPREGVGKKLS